MNSVELDADARSLVLGQLVTCSRPIATRQQCVPAMGEASSASAPTDDTARSAWLPINTQARCIQLFCSQDLALWVLLIPYHYSAIKSQNTVKPNPLCRLPVTFATSRDVPFSPNSITPTSRKLPVQGSFREVVTGSRHSGLGFTVFWLFTAVFILLLFIRSYYYL